MKYAILFCMSAAIVFTLAAIKPASSHNSAKPVMDMPRPAKIDPHYDLTMPQALQSVRHHQVSTVRGLYAEFLSQKKLAAP
ncbi:hypothetical protein [Magnetococcus sp. PR-3]|uniref:hypothetical protein n=1 Tax=Magnetococcus sp. PR-3 TaxID=3120355 RepID=UPI002FCE5FAC